METKGESAPLGTLALLGGSEWTEPCRDIDEALLVLAAFPSTNPEVLILPTAAAFELPDRAVDAARSYFERTGVAVTVCRALGRTETQSAAFADQVRAARFIYLSDGSPQHLRSALKKSALYDALVEAWRSGAVVAASGAAAAVLCDPMVDARGGAFTVGLGLVPELSVLPHHDTAPVHLRDRSISLQPKGTRLVGVDEATALIREPSGAWRVLGAGAATIYGSDGSASFASGADLPPN